MEALNERSLARVISHRVLQMGISFPCQICVVGFLCEVCLASFILAALTSFGTLQLDRFSFSTMSMLNLSWNSDLNNNINCNFKPKETERLTDLKSREEREYLLYSAWSCVLTKSESECLLKLGIRNHSFPPWTSWKGLLDTHPAAATTEQIKILRRQAVLESAYPPWIAGSDEENYPLTRKVQRDIWIHQHPLNCNNPNVKFLLADWERLPGFGIGAQIAGMCGLLAIAINERRVLVTNFYNRADHDGCKGSSRSSWNCYFFLETSLECRQRALELMRSEDAWSKGIVTTKENYTSRHIWAGPTPRIWGEPWNYLQPTTDINGSLVASHRKLDRRWWRAQAVRYLMRFPTEYTCNLLNEARHAAFGKIAAEMVLESPAEEWPEENRNKSGSGIEEYVWSNHKPWIPRPLLSIHVRMGDKACEMKVVEFEEYMQLADRIRRHFPNLNSIWLSTEMQEVIDKIKEYSGWNFHYTKVRRQGRTNVSMAKYEASLGRESSTNYPLVNFMMAADSDFFVGALGSTWCFLIDGMRNTGGKVMAGYLSVNKDRFW
ncbi:hypothetical protein AAZX31_03G229400 [Glycine max]|nr:uncharacterized protein LOC114407733 isoform X2 [Glycine soja]XP_040870172.1 uncharacterized protein LOC100802896 isoform X2 [Glycine max]KAG4394200.1 hypothetical protein GLYMA_03G250300v4 [Glycine max]